MIYITEAQSGAAISHELAFNAVRRAFIAVSTPAAAIFPVVLGSASDPQNKFTIKSAADGTLTGLKVGSYFPTNDAAGLPRHDSMIMLFDQTKGRIGAIVEPQNIRALKLVPIWRPMRCRLSAWGKRRQDGERSQSSGPFPESGPWRK